MNPIAKTLKNSVPVAKIIVDTNFLKLFLVQWSSIKWKFQYELLSSFLVQGSGIKWKVDTSSSALVLVHWSSDTWNADTNFLAHYGQVVRCQMKWRYRFSQFILAPVVQCQKNADALFSHPVWSSGSVSYKNWCIVMCTFVVQWSSVKWNVDTKYLNSFMLCFSD